MNLFDIAGFVMQWSAVIVVGLAVLLMVGVVAGIVLFVRSFR